MSSFVDRRTALVTGLAAGAVLIGQGCATAQNATSASATAPKPKPLAFDPKAVPGFSERILTSHYANNYVGAVNRIGAIRNEIAKLDFATAPGFAINGLKREELLAMNSMILHEAYFASLGPAGARPDAALARQIEIDFGSNDKWRSEFTAMGKALGGGSGWVLLSWSPRLGQLVNQWAFDHTMTLADGNVLIALDMYEHAYHMDFGAKAGAYVDAFMNALNWTIADRIFGSSRT